METIIAHPNFEYLADNIVSKNDTIKKWSVKFEYFKDGWPNFYINDIEKDIEHKSITYIWDFSKPEYLFENYSIIRALIGYYADRVRVIVPFFPVGTMERISEKWEVATSRYMADILSNFPSWRNHKTSIHIFDIHTLEQRFFFDDFKVNPELHTAMSLIKAKISKDTIVVFPDEWAKKRFSKDFEWYEVIACSKVRKWEEREIVINDWNVSWKEVVIVDDLIQTWWTIIKTAELLRKLWASKVIAFATHWVFPDNSHIKLCSVVDILYATDTIPFNYKKMEDIHNLTVLSISDIINKQIICRNWKYCNI